MVPVQPAVLDAWFLAEEHLDLVEERVRRAEDRLGEPPVQVLQALRDRGSRGEFLVAGDPADDGVQVQRGFRVPMPQNSAASRWSNAPRQMLSMTRPYRAFFSASRLDMTDRADPQTISRTGG